VEGSCEHRDEPWGSLKSWESSEVAAQLAASQEGLSSVSKYHLKKYITTALNFTFTFQNQRVSNRFL
jgi:hypothetical protein